VLCFIYSTSEWILCLWLLLFSHLPLLMIGSRSRAEKPAWACLVGLEGKYLGSGSLVIKAGNKLLFLWAVESFTRQTVESHPLTFQLPFMQSKRVNDPTSWCMKGTVEAALGKHSSVPLMRHDLSVLWSLTLTRITSQRNVARETDKSLHWCEFSVPLMHFYPNEPDRTRT